MSTRPLRHSIALLSLLHACGTAPDLSPSEQRQQREQWELRSQRLLQPLLNDSNVACGELVIDITPNYFVNVAQPAIDPNLQGERKSKVDGFDEYEWINKVGGLQGAIVLTIGAPDELTEKGVVRGKGTRFTVLNRAVLRVRTAGKMEATLDVTASGRPMVSALGGAIRDLTVFELRNGLLQAQ
ncbi:MAG: hypothetical protein ABL997_00120 [Planctomycetota bacterium]